MKDLLARLKPNAIIVAAFLAGIAMADMLGNGKDAQIGLAAVGALGGALIAILNGDRHDRRRKPLRRRKTRSPRRKRI